MAKYSCFFVSKFRKIRISLEARKEKHTVLLLMAYISAHEIAQGKLHDMLYVNEDGDNGSIPKGREEQDVIDVSMKLVQEAKMDGNNGSIPKGREEQDVIDESMKLVQEAKNILFHQKIDRQVVQLILTKRISRLVLHEEVDIINKLVDNGFLLPTDAESEFFTIIRHDAYLLEKSRKKDQRKVIQERMDANGSIPKASVHVDANNTDNVLLQQIEL